VDARPHQSLLPSASERPVDLYQGLELAELRLRQRELSGKEISFHRTTTGQAEGGSSSGPRGGPRNENRFAAEIDEITGH
jgi:hypothetical protein